ncbi:MAG TPA: hypothetical protein VFA04_02765 [Bryobacteraceae bacterium]|nr:hypothetical protein [Bryobacteraceae bacterium]
MSFLDNLENNLKSLEREQENSAEDRRRQEEERARAVAAAPWAQRLKESDYTKRLMDAAVVAGHRRRMKVYISWIGTTLRLEARERRLELRPTAEGIQAVVLENGNEVSCRAVELGGEPAGLVADLLP